MNLSSIFLLFSKIFFTESLISFLFESWRQSAAVCHKQTSPLCHYAWVRGASLPILLFEFWYASFIFFLLFAFQISNFAFAICIFSILHSVLCILYFAFCICIPTSWHFHHSAVWFTWFDTNLHYQAVRNIFFNLSEFFRMLPIICLHLWAARNLLQNRTNDKLKQFQTFFLKKFLRTSVNSIPKSGTNMKR